MDPLRTIPPDLDGENSDDADSALADWLEQIDVGVVPDVERFLSRYPTIADRLRPRLHSWIDFHAAVPPLSPVTDAGTTDATLRTIRTSGHLFAAGRIRLADFELLEEIGRGGMGVVFRARQVSLDRIVAVKVLRLDDVQRTNAERIQNEAALVARLDHPRIVPVYHVGCEDGLPYFAMKWIDGSGLDQRLSEYAARPRESAKLLSTIAKAVHFAHQRGVLHRDIKPSNILIDAEGRPHIADFGLAKDIGADNNLTQSGTLIGTPSYMAPEQAKGDSAAITTASDVYGLGAVLYAMLTGVPPFRGPNVFETLRRVQTEDAVFSDTFRSLSDSELRTICLKCLSKEPAHRYGSADALARDLDRWLDGQPVHARPASPAFRFWKWVKRQPMTAAFAATCIFALIGFTAGVLVHFDRINDELATSDRLRTEGLAREAEMRRLLYFADLRAAKPAIDTGNLARAKELLARWTPKEGQEDLRGAEWKYLADRANYEPVLLGKHAAPVISASVSTDGRLLATGDYSGVVKIWNIDKRTVEREWKEAFTEAIVRFSPDGKLFAVGTRGPAIRLWDTTTWNVCNTLFGFTNTVRTIDFSSDGKKLAAGLLSNTVLLWNIDETMPFRKIAAHADHVQSVQWILNDSHILSCSNDGTTKVWNARTGDIAKTISEGLPTKFHAAQASPLANFYATGGTLHRLKIRHADTLEVVADVDMQHTIRSMRFSPDGRFLAVVGNFGVVCVLEHTIHGTFVRRFLRDGEADVRAVAFSTDSETLFTGSDLGEVKIWPLRPFLTANRSFGPSQIHGTASDAKVLAVRSGYHVQIFGLDDARPESSFTIEHPVEAPFAISSAGNVAAFVQQSGDVGLWRLNAKGRFAILPRDSKDQFVQVALSRSGAVLATATASGSICLWDAHTAKLQRVLRPAGGSNMTEASLAFSKDGESLVCRLSIAHEELTAWTVTDGAQLWSISIAERGADRFRNPVAAVCRNGKYVAASVGDRLVRVWSMATGKEQATFSGFVDRVSGIVFTPDSSQIITTSEDRSVRLWHIPTAQEIYSLDKLPRPAVAIALSEDGRSLYAPMHLHDIAWWTFNPVR